MGYGSDIGVILHLASRGGSGTPMTKPRPSTPAKWQMRTAALVRDILFDAFIGRIHVQ